MLFKSSFRETTLIVSGGATGSWLCVDYALFLREEKDGCAPYNSYYVLGCVAKMQVFLTIDSDRS
jgi:hypothetical protein